MFKKLKSLAIIILAVIVLVPSSLAAVDNVSPNVSYVDNTTVDNVSPNVNYVDNTTIDNVSPNVSYVDNTTDNTTIHNNSKVIEENEMKILGNSYGAQVRLLQLKRRVEFQAEAGEIIIDEINKENPEFNTSELGRIVEEFYVLVGLIEEYNIDKNQDILSQD